MSPLISVVIPTFQRCKKLKNALVSVLGQTYKNFEVLIIDDGSTDGTKEMVNSIKDSRVSYIWQKNSGKPANPRNRGIKLAKANWIAFLDSDDIWKKNKLSEVSKYLSEKNQFIYHDFSIIDYNKNSKEKVIKSSSLKDPKCIELLINGNTIGLSTVIVSKKLLIKINGFNEDERMTAAEDYNAWLKIAKISDNFFYLPKNLSYYSSNEDSISNQDMSIPKSFAMKEYMHLLSNRQKIIVKTKLKYNSGCFNLFKKRFKYSTKCFFFVIKYGSLLYKTKSIIRLFQIFSLRFFSYCENY